MDFRKINSYVILLAIVVVVGLLVSMVARLVILAKGADTGTANLVFIIVMGICMIFYLTVMAAFSSVADFVADKIFPKIAGKICQPPSRESSNLPTIFQRKTSSRSNRKLTNDSSNDRKNRSNCFDVMRIER